MSRCSFAIVGGGLAGLATAHALKAFGLEAHVFEQAPALGEIGAAVSISPQAVKALRAFGLGEAVAAIGQPSPPIHTYDMRTGALREVSDRPALAERYGAPFYTFHRADLLDALSAGVDPHTVHLGRRLTGIEETADGVRLAFEAGGDVEAQFVIAADGVRSVARGALHVNDRPSYTGQMAWRALLDGREVDPGLMGPTGYNQWIAPGRHLLAYYIRNGRMVNVVTQQDTDGWVEEGWSIRGDPAEMRASFAHAEPRMAALLSLVTTCSKWGLFTRPLTLNWGRGRIQLIGDAAHAMLPNAGQGASQAFEDAYVLGRWLEACDDAREAFAGFRRVRIPRVQGVQRLALANARVKHLRATEAAARTDAPASVHGDADWVWGFDLAADWNKPPHVPLAYAG